MPHDNSLRRFFITLLYFFPVPIGEGGPKYGSNGIRTRATHVTGGRVNRCTMEPTPLLGVEPRIAE